LYVATNSSANSTKNETDLEKYVIGGYIQKYHI
jgi:hypothetical protein